MGRIEQISAKLEQVTREKIEGDLLSILRQHEATAVDLNIMQLDKGITALGERINPEYSPITVEIKKLKGQPYDRVTLEDEGDYKRGKFMKADRWPIMFGSTDWKDDKLTEKYSDDIDGLTQESIKSLGVEVKPDYKRYFEDLFSV